AAVPTRKVLPNISANLGSGCGNVSSAARVRAALPMALTVSTISTPIPRGGPPNQLLSMQSRGAVRRVGQTGFQDSRAGRESPATTEGNVIRWRRRDRAVRVSGVRSRDRPVAKTPRRRGLDMPDILQAQPNGNDSAVVDGRTNLGALAATIRTAHAGAMLATTN